jgi:hypothetical protein
MAFTGVFEVSQTSDLTSLVITDTSSYSSEGQGTFSGRRIYLYKVDGTTLVPDGTTTQYVDFPFSDGASKTITGVLNTDYSLLVNVIWLSNAPQPGSTYTAQSIETFLNYLYAFYAGQISTLSDNPAILQDNNWYDSMIKLIVEISNAEQATVDGQQFSAQAAINRALYLKDNSQFFF